MQTKKSIDQLIAQKAGCSLSYVQSIRLGQRASRSRKAHKVRQMLDMANEYREAAERSIRRRLR